MPCSRRPAGGVASGGGRTRRWAYQRSLRAALAQGAADGPPRDPAGRLGSTSFGSMRCDRSPSYAALTLQYADAPRSIQALSPCTSGAWCLIRPRVACAPNRRQLPAEVEARGSSLGHQTAHAAADQESDVAEHPRQGKAARRRQVAGFPDRLELRLETQQTLKVVEMLAVAEQEGAGLAPQRRQPPALQPGERDRAEA